MRTVLVVPDDDPLPISNSLSISNSLPRVPPAALLIRVTGRHRTEAAVAALDDALTKEVTDAVMARATHVEHRCSICGMPGHHAHHRNHKSISLSRILDAEMDAACAVTPVGSGVPFQSSVRRSGEPRWRDAQQQLARARRGQDHDTQCHGAPPPALMEALQARDDVAPLSFSLQC